MAQILNDFEIKKLIDNGIIINGDYKCIVPNSYKLRLGNEGEILNSKTKFSAEDGKKALKILPGHSVGITSFEYLNFDRNCVRKLYPGEDLHAIISPTTDLSREGIIAPTTQVDSGFIGSLNWTLNNTSGFQKKFKFGDELFRLTIFKLGASEAPENPYDGKYNESSGYVPSLRNQPPDSIRDEEYAQTCFCADDTELARSLISWGYPWEPIGERLLLNENLVEQQKTQYEKLLRSIGGLSAKIDHYRSEIGPDLKRESTILLYGGIVALISIILAITGMGLHIAGSPELLTFCTDHNHGISFLLIFFGFTIFFLNLFIFLQLSGKRRRYATRDGRPIS